MLLIDGNNLWYAAMACGEPLAGISRHALVAMLDRFARQAGEPVVVVLDGHPRTRPGGWADDLAAIERIFAGSRSADDVIGRLAAESSHPRQLTVVTSDRSLARQVRKRRARVVDSGRFAAQLEKWLNRPAKPMTGREPASKQSGLGGSANLIEEWLHFFHLTTETSDIIRSDRAGFQEREPISQPADISVASPSPNAVPKGARTRSELTRAFIDVQPLKRRRRRIKPPRRKERANGNGHA